MIAVALDGPSGVGKSTVAKQIAERKGFIYMDTGALYRAIGLFVLDNGLDTEQPQQVLSVLPKVQISLEFSGGEQRVKLCGEDVSEKIREHRISKAASDVSALPEVRAYLLDMQRDFAKTHNVVMDGRDIGTVILPDAQVKVFLTAEPETRAKRRQLQLLEKGEQVPLETILADIEKRDANDSGRAVAPLSQAVDAVLVDNSCMTLNETIETIISLIEERCGKS